jgi:hypothetical protein
MDKSHLYSEEGLFRETQITSYWERKKIKEVIDEALGSYLKGKRIRKKTNR